MRNELFDDAVKERLRKDRERSALRGRRAAERRRPEGNTGGAHDELYPDPKRIVIRTGPDPLGYDGRSLDEMDAEERYAERARRAEVALTMGARITDEERELLGLK